MKKILLIALSAMALNAHAQYQFENPGFEDGFNATSGEATHWHGFKSASGSWASMASSTFAASEDVREGATGKYSVVVTSTSILGIVANGTFTNGRLNAGSMSAANTDNHSETSLSDTNTDKDGNPFYTAFTGKPDSIQMWMKFTQGTANATYPYATVSTIITDGTYYQDPEDKEYTNKVAVAKNSEIATCDWSLISVPFDYDSYASNNVSPAAILLTVSTNATPGQGSKGDCVYVDDIALIYNSSLQSVTYDNANVAVASEMTVDAEYDESKLALVSDGVGATIESSYDESTALLTVTVKGNNISSDATNYHSYTIQFAKAAESEANTKTYTDSLVGTINGESTEPIAAKVEVTYNDDGTIDFSLTNFILVSEGNEMPVGNINIPGMTLTEGESYSTFSYDDNLQITAGDAEGVDMWFGPYLGNIPLKLEGEITDDQLHVTIDIDMTSTLGQTIYVEFGEEISTSNGINAIVNSQSTKGDDAVYDLSGRRVGAAQKGIVIINGKKVIR